MVQTEIAIGPPPIVRRISRTLTWLLRHGVPLGPLRLLRTRQHTAGIPVVVLRHAGQRWLVSVFGEVAWVRRLRATGTARLARGRHVEAVAVTEVLDQRRAEVAWRLRRSFRTVPFVRAAFTAHPRGGIAAFLNEAPRHPVFLISTPDTKGHA